MKASGNNLVNDYCSEHKRFSSSRILAVTGENGLSIVTRQVGLFLAVIDPHVVIGSVTAVVSTMN
jgi:small neutral amino acid transporter SnatA (MarC family)